VHSFYSFITTFIAIFAAEIGDKTNILVLCLAMLYPLRKIFVSIFLATLILMLIAVLSGNLIVKIIPDFFIKLISGILFLGFGASNFFKKNDENELNCDEKNLHLKIFSSFFLAELGDKTQISTFLFAAKFNNFLPVYLGSVFGVILPNILSILLGNFFSKFLNFKIIKIISGVIFILIGLLTLFEIIF
jgi:putative Ca2+/H+ antiporter (TMEM165/GDT1 family)